MHGLIEICLYVAAYWVASKAVQSWSELAMLIVVTTLVTWPVKVLGAYLAPAFAEDMVTILTGPRWSLSFHPTVAFPVAVFIASVLMLVGEEIYIRVKGDGVEREGS